MERRIESARSRGARATGVAIAASALLVAGCGDTSFGTLIPPVEETTGLDPSVCSGELGLPVDHPYHPLVVGARRVLEGEEDGEVIRLELEVVADPEIVDGVATRVLEERELEDGEVVEVARSYFAQASDGTVCSLGRDVDEIEDGEVVGNHGSWRSGADGAVPGVRLPATPALGQTFAQETAIGIAEDQAEIVALGQPTIVPAGTFTDTVELRVTSPLDEDPSTRVYARDVGLIESDVLELVER